MLSFTAWIFVLLFSNFLPATLCTLQEEASGEILILNPQIPYNGEIPNGLQDRKMVRLDGVVAENADRFEVNLLTGPNGLSALSLPFDLDVNITSNSPYCEKLYDKRGNVLSLGEREKFEIIIFPDAFEFKVTVNGQYSCELPYYIPIEDITYLSITGDITVRLISWEQVGDPIPDQLEPLHPVLYHGLIPDGLKQGKTLRFQGVAPQNFRFAVNYLVGPKINPWDDTPFYMDMRMAGDQVVLNSFQEGWGEELFYELPIVAEEPFEIVILPGANEYKIGINGEFFHTFPYRLDLETCTYILLEGDAAITLVSWEGIVPPLHEYNPPIPLEQTPHSNLIPNGLTEGKKLTIQGVVLQNAKSFFINFQTSRELGPDNEIGLQVAVRLSQDYVGLNSFSDGIWGGEAYGKLHVLPGEQFEITILADTNEFEIEANEKHCGVFPYRITRSQMTHVVIYGDVTITSISWKGGV